jgi:hypothetical protein
VPNLACILSQIEPRHISSPLDDDKHSESRNNALKTRETPEISIVIKLTQNARLYPVAPVLRL